MSMPADDVKRCANFKAGAHPPGRTCCASEAPRLPSSGRSHLVPMLGALRPIRPLAVLRRALLGRRRVAALASTGIGLLTCAAASTALAANVLPDATFGVFPGDPFSGETVQFVSYACDPDGRVAEQAWDLDGDGGFDDAFGPSASRVFPVGSAVVGLRVTGDAGGTASRWRTLEVGPRPQYPVPRQFRPPLLSPAPFVRLAGMFTARGVRVQVLSVRAPVCSRVTVRCRGRSCPWRRSNRVVGRKRVRFRALQRELAAGVVLEVFVRKQDRIGKYTRFSIRANKAPARRDLCLAFRARQGSPCPPS